ncbi:MAG: BadF/BadG/BcrA/BcrD ATPase family protein [Chloroflexota bacterium]
MDKQLVLGVDGGGTKTACVAIDLNGTVLGTGQSGSANYHNVGKETAYANVQQAIQQTLTLANSSFDDVGSICLGIAGVDRLNDRKIVAKWVERLLPNTPYQLHNDAVIALASGTGGKLHGIVVICGTGMIVYGIDHQGQHHRVAGRGPLLGDDGGGYNIGINTLKAITAAHDGMGPKTMLTQTVFAHLKLNTVDDLLTWTYRDTSWHRIAQLSQLTQTCANAGDVVAGQLVAQAADALFLAISAILTKLDDGEHQPIPLPLVLAGGNLRPGPLNDALTKRLLDHAPLLNVIRPTVEPVMGAAYLALGKV